MRSILTKAILALFIGGLAFGATGKLQNADFATSASILGAGGSLNQLLNTSKVWNDLNSELLNTTLSRVSGSVLSVGTFGSSPNSAGASVANQILTLQPASAAFPGGITTGSQTIAGTKSFSSAPIIDTYTSGSIAYIATGSLLNQDAGNFVWNDFSHRLGINTSVTPYALTLGSISSALQNSVTSAAMGVSSATTAKFVGENTLPQATGQGSFFNLYQNDGTAMLSGNRLGGFIFGGSSSASNLRNSVSFSAFADSDWIDGNNYGSYLSFQTTASGSINRLERMRITGDGKVGIGMADPMSPLSVLAQGTTTNSSESISLRSKNAAIVSGNMIGGIAFRSNTTALANPGSNSALIDAVAEATHASGVLDTALTFSTASNSVPVERMRITSSGSVAVGTTSPNAKIQITNDNEFLFGETVNAYGTGRSDYNMFKSLGTLSSPTMITNNTNIGSINAGGYYTGKVNPYFGAGDNRAALRLMSAEDWSSSAANGTYITIFTTPWGSSTVAERMRVDASGYIGIGLTDPKAPIDVAAISTTVNASESIQLRSQRAAIVAGNLINGVAFRSNDTSLTAPGTVVALEDAVAESTHTTTDLSTALTWYTTNALTMAERMRISASGSLGIGTTSPTNQLHATGSVRFSNYAAGATSFDVNGVIQSGTLSVTNGGTGQVSANAAFNALSPNTTSGDITVYNGSANQRLARGSNTQVLTVDNTVSGGLKWATPGGGSSSIRQWYVDFGGASEGTTSCGASPCTIYRQLDSSGNTDTVSSVTRTGLGRYVINITGGRCSAAATCVGHQGDPGGFGVYYQQSVPTSTAAYARFSVSSGSDGDSDGYFLCSCAP